MAILSIISNPPGVVDIVPSLIYINTNDSMATVLTTGYLNNAAKAFGISFTNSQMAITYTTDGPALLEVHVSGAVVSLATAVNPGTIVLPTIANHIATYTNTAGTLSEDAATAINGGNIQAGLSGTAGYVASFPATASKGSLRVTAVANTNDTVTTISNAAMGQASVISIPDPGASTATFLLSAVAAGQTVAASTASATPGTIRALVGAMTESNSVMTSGNLVGVRGSVTYVGASGGFLYGVQGKLIASGTLSGSSWNAGVFAQVDISAATMNAGQIAPVWADYGATSGTLTDVTGMRMFAGTNTTAAVLNSMIYLYGKATSLLELSGSTATYITSGGAGAPSGTVQKIAITIDGVVYYLVASTIVS